MWWLIPAILTLISIVLIILSVKYEWMDDVEYTWAEGVTIFVSIICVISFIIFPISYYDNRNMVWENETYYNQIVNPNIIDIGTDYVVVSNTNAGIWQAGESNVSDYNKWLIVQRYWQDTLWGKLVYYRISDDCKYVRVK
jgi:hypothetical protein